MGASQYRPCHDTSPYTFWKREGRTPSSGTGPSAGVGGSGSYVYARASRARWQGDFFKLNYDGSACSGTGLGVSTVAFYYHMYGAAMGELRVTNAAGEVVWSLSGNQGNSWQAATVGVHSLSFKFEYFRGDGSYTTGDAALALVAVSCGEQPPSPPSPPLPPPSAPAYFAVVGPCTVDGACARSPNYPSEYGNSQSCTITPTSLAVGQRLSATTFNTESRYDKLIVNNGWYGMCRAAVAVHMCPSRVVHRGRYRYRCYESKDKPYQGDLNTSL